MRRVRRGGGSILDEVAKGLTTIVSQGDGGNPVTTAAAFEKRSSRVVRATRRAKETRTARR